MPEKIVEIKSYLNGDKITTEISGKGGEVLSLFEALVTSIVAAGGCPEKLLFGSFINGLDEAKKRKEKTHES